MYIYNKLVNTHTRRELKGGEREKVRGYGVNCRILYSFHVITYTPIHTPVLFENGVKVHLSTRVIIEVDKCIQVEQVGDLC